MKTFWFDQRDGCWTRVEFKEQQIRVFLGRNHAAGVVVGAVAFAMFFACIIQAFLQLLGMFWLMATLLFPIFYLQLRSITKHRSVHLPLLIVADGSNQQNGFARVIFFSDVTAVVVVENVERDEVEDSGLAQVYLELVSEEFALLIYQQYLNRSAQVIELGQRVAQNIGTAFQNRLRVQ